MEKKKPKTKILYVITKSNWGGAQRYVYDIATNLPDNFEAVVALGGDGELKERLYNAGIRTITLPSLERDVKLFVDFSIFKKLILLFKEERPDIIHLNSSKIGGLGAIAGRIAKIPRIIFTAHGWAFREERPLFQKIAIKFLSWLTILWSNVVITVSDRDRREALSLPFTKSKITLIHNGISDMSFLEKNIARKKIFEHSSLSKGNILFPKKDTFWVGTIGELHKNKGHMYALEAIRLLREKVHILFFIIGEGEEKATIQEKIIELQLENTVILLGKRTDAVALLPAFDVFLFPSVKEGLPYTILEAGVAGLPVISSAVGGITEIITDMESGILVRPKNSEEIVKAFDFLISHQKEMKHFGKKLHTNVVKNFSLKKMLRETLSVYKTPK